MIKMLEICCGSFEDAMTAYECGVRRIELNSALSLGGLTPSLGSLIMTKQYTDLEVMAMIRSREAGFCYTEYQYEQMLEDMKLMLAYGSDGIVFGFLKEDRTIDEKRCREFVENIHNEGRQAVFHRAFDCAKDANQAIETLIDLGVDRVLTSGQAPTAEEGIALLSKLQKEYGKQIEILAGCGIHAENVKKIIEETEILQIHSSCGGWREDFTTKGEQVSFAISSGKHENQYETVSVDKITNLLKICG